MSEVTVFRLPPHESGRLAELHNLLYREDISEPAWSGDRLRALYQGMLASGKMAVWIARSDIPESGVGTGGSPRCTKEESTGQDIAYIWFQGNQGEFSLKEVGCLPESRSAPVYTALIEAGLDWVRQKGGKDCRFSGAEGDQTLERALNSCGFLLEVEHIQMHAGLDQDRLQDSNLETRSFAEIGDASWLLNLVEDCLECRHAYDRQDLLDLIKRHDNLSFTAWADDQPVGFIMGEILPMRLGGRLPILRYPPEQVSGGQSGSEDSPVFYVREIGVRPAFRRQGYATRILAEGFARGRERGMREARLHVVGDNQAGLGLYHKLGFEEVRRVGWWKLS